MQPSHLKALRAVLDAHPEWSKLTSQEVADAIHFREPYDVPQEPIPAPLSLEAMLGVLSTDSVGNLLTLPCFTDLRDKVLAQDRAGVGLYAQVLVAGGKITLAEYAAIDSQLKATVTPPAKVAKRKSVFDSSLRYLGPGEGEDAGFPNLVRAADVDEARGL